MDNAQRKILKDMEKIEKALELVEKECLRWIPYSQTVLSEEEKYDEIMQHRYIIEKVWKILRE